MPSSPASIEDATQLAELVITALEHGTLSVVHKNWGHELIIETGAFLLKVIEVDVDQRTSLQHHEVKDEVQWVLSAEGGGGVYIETTDDDGPCIEKFGMGDHIRVRPGTVHRTVGPCLLVEVTTLHNDDVVRHEDDYGRAYPTAEDHASGNAMIHRVLNQGPPGYSAGIQELGYEGDG